MNEEKLTMEGKTHRSQTGRTYVTWQSNVPVQQVRSVYYYILS